MSDANDHSVTHWINQLRAKDSVAAHQLWQRYVQHLIQLAGRKLGMRRRVADEDDMANEAFEAFLRGVKEQRFERLENRQDLWQLLVMLTERRVIDWKRQQLAEKRGRGEVRGESVVISASQDSAGGFAQLPARDPTPQFAMEVRERLNVLLDSLDDQQQRRIALLKLEGFKNQEIAAQLKTSLRAVERKLNLIRQQWQEHTDQDSTSAP